MAITARDHFRNFLALYTSLSTAVTFLLKTSSHRALQIPWWGLVSVMQQTFWSNFNPILFKVQTLQTWMRKGQQWFVWPNWSDVCPKDAFRFTNELNHMACSTQEAVWSDHWIPAYTNSVNPPGSTKGVQCQHPLPFEFRFAFRRSEAVCEPSSGAHCARGPVRSRTEGAWLQSGCHHAHPAYSCGWGLSEWETRDISTPGNLQPASPALMQDPKESIPKYIICLSKWCYTALQILPSWY